MISVEYVPNPKWSPTDRFKVGAEIAFKVKERYKKGGSLMGLEVMDATERLVALLGEEARDLEIHRERILRGIP